MAKYTLLETATLNQDRFQFRTVSQGESGANLIAEGAPEDPIIFTSAESAEAEYLQITFSDVLVSSYQTGGALEADAEFDLTGESDPVEIALLLPAIQQAREAARDDRGGLRSDGDLVQAVAEDGSSDGLF